MAKVKIQLNSAEVEKLLKSSEIESVLSEVAENVRDKCGNGYKTAKAYKGRHRLNIEVFADTYSAKRDNARNNTLLKAVKT